MSSQHIEGAARSQPGTPIGSISEVRVPVTALGMSLGMFFAITFVLCVGVDLLFPGMAMYESWMRFLPGLTWLSWPSFALGLAESYVYGWYVALVFGPLFNFFAARRARS